MSKIDYQPARKIWQPLNRKSQIVATLGALTLAAGQLYLWQARSAQSASAGLQPVQPLLKSQDK